MKTTLQIFILLIGINYLGYSQSQLELINKAYKKKSEVLLTEFFENWANEIKPISKSEFDELGDTIKEAYKVFECFYRPTELSQIGGSEWGESLYNESKYLVVQNNLYRIKFVDRLYCSEKEIDSITVAFYKKLFKNDTVRLNKELKRDENGKLPSYVYENWDIDINNSKKSITVDSIVFFRPPIDNPDKKVVYLTPEYEKTLNDFLKNKYIAFGKRNIMNPARSKGSSLRRKEFLDRFVTTFHGHWGGYWELLTFPHVYCITFDKDMKFAKVDFEMVYEGGEALLEKKGDKWKILKAELTWIE